ncbi:MAG TPA: hypothetical protein VG755_11305 [Nannocystaceae bacterium]|nr:hypothetical protein [Nannocystaceae bacterium]
MARAILCSLLVACACVGHADEALPVLVPEVELARAPVVETPTPAQRDDDAWVVALGVRNASASALATASDGSTLAVLWSSRCTASTEIGCVTEDLQLDFTSLDAHGRRRASGRVPHVDRFVSAHALADRDRLVLVGHDGKDPQLATMALDIATGSPLAKAMLPVRTNLPMDLRRTRDGGLALVTSRPDPHTEDQRDQFALVQLDRNHRALRHVDIGGGRSARPFVLQSVAFAPDGSIVGAGVCPESERVPRSPPCSRIASEHGFVAHWQPNGTLVWSRALVPGDRDGAGVWTDGTLVRDDGSAIVHGYHHETLELRGTGRRELLPRNLDGGARELFASYDAHGELEWVIEEDGTFELWAIDEAGRAWVTSQAAVFVGAIDRGGEWVVELGSWDLCTDSARARPLGLALADDGIRVLATLEPAARICALEERTAIRTSAGVGDEAILVALPTERLLARGG